MKRFTYFSLAILALTSIAAISASAQTDYKFGKVTRAELERTDYPAIVDGADAVALEDLTDLLIIADSCFDAKFDAFARFYYSHRKVIRKIKILNSDGLKYANIKIPHRHARHPRKRGDAPGKRNGRPEEGEPACPLPGYAGGL